MLGSANADLVLRVAGIPAPGETVLATGTSRSPGGKGLNQAVAAARHGARTAFVGAVGDDEDGRMLRAVLTEDGIQAHLRESTEATGLAVVLVEDSGENAIVVASGANAAVGRPTPAELAVVTAGRVLLIQLELPVPAVLAAAEAAHAAGVRVVLNAAPARRLPVELLGCLDVLVVNEHEARVVAGTGEAPLDAAVDALLATVPQVVVTLGAAGCLYRGRGGVEVRLAAPAVEAVDTTGAGDTFVGVLVAALADAVPVSEALRLAVVAGSLCVQRRGAVPAIPRRAEVLEALASGTS